MDTLLAKSLFVSLLVVELCLCKVYLYAVSVCNMMIC